MQTYQNWDIQEIPLWSPFFRNRVERFLGANGLRMETFDAYYTIQNTEGEILAGAGLSGNTIKCVAVREDMRSEGLTAPLISHIISTHPGQNLLVFTKPENEAVFQSMGFHLLSRAPKAVLMENGRGLERYCQYLGSLRRPGRSGVIVMNANPFTLGHRFLLEQAASQVDTLYVIPVKEDRSVFPYEERLDMIRRGIPDTNLASRVLVPEGSDYCISAATFPTYFLKDLTDASETQMRLDLDLFGRHIAPALGATVRFVGTEPLDPLTARYNALMQEVLPIEVVEIPRLRQGDLSTSLEMTAVSASAVRAALERGSFHEASALTPATTHPYLLAFLADRALRMELDTPLKPGLVGPDGPGAHHDMNYATMEAGIRSLRPFWPMMAVAPDADSLQQLGIDAEAAMMAATGGVNTHRGAIFALGLAINAAWQAFAAIGRRMDIADFQDVMQNRLVQITQTILRKSVIPNDFHSTPIGARRIALTGYQELWNDWLPFYSKTMEISHLQATLLRIMSSLDDTCVIKRAGAERAEEVQREAKALLEDFSQEKLKDMCTRYAQKGISPGGAADMLALTIFIHSII